VAIDSLQEFRDKRQHDADTPQTHRVLEESADIAADSLGNPIRELALRIAEEAGRAAEYRVRLELTEQAQSSLEEELAEERIRREQAEQRVAELEGRLRALVAPREASREKAPEEPSGTQIPPEEERRSWWRRLIGG
jgi:chromosome segregation ATPase